MQNKKKIIERLNYNINTVKLCMDIVIFLENKVFSICF